MGRFLEFYRNIDNPRSRDYRLLVMSSGIIFLFLLMLATHLNTFTIIVGVISIPILIVYHKNTPMIEKTSVVIMLILLFEFAKISNHPLALAVFAGMALFYLNQFLIKDENYKIKLEGMLVIILTIVILQTSYPLFKPLVEIVSIDEVTSGLIHNETPYGYQYYTLSVLPPLFSPSCTEMILGYRVLGAFSDTYHFGININTKENGVTEFCTPFFEFTKRIVRLNVVSEQPIRYDIYDKNLTRFWWIKEGDDSIRVHTISVYNREKYPIRFRGNISFIINKETMLDGNTNLWDYLHNNTCRLITFRLSENKDQKSGDFSGYQIEDDKITLMFPIYLNVPSYNYTLAYIQFDPYACDNITD